MLWIFTALGVFGVIAALIFVGRTIGPPDLSSPAKEVLSTEILQLHLRTNRDWINKYRRLPLQRKSAALKDMHTKKMEYVTQLELELIGRHQMAALGGMVSGSLGPLYQKIHRLQQQGISEDEAINMAMTEVQKTSTKEPSVPSN